MQKGTGDVTAFGMCSVRVFVLPGDLVTNVKKERKKKKRVILLISLMQNGGCSCESSVWFPGGCTADGRWSTGSHCVHQLCLHLIGVPKQLS